MLIGYARVSTIEQNLNLQQDALKESGCEKIIVDKLSGALAERPGLTKIKELLRKGDTLEFHLIGALSEFERNLIRERTQAGLLAARARGRKGGRPMSLDKDKRELVISLYEEKKLPVKKICQMMNITKPTLYSYVRGKGETANGGTVSGEQSRGGASKERASKYGKAGKPARSAKVLKSD
jgi:DNA invertase Pin-like site-specific DNA recombinase